MKFEPKKLINGQSLIDFAIENYGCYEGLFLLLADNPDVVQAVSQILPPGTELRVRTPAPELTESNKTIVSQYIAQAVAVACGDCSSGSIQIGTPTIDCEGALLTIPFTTEGLPEGDTLNIEKFEDGAWVDADGESTGDISEVPINAPFALPISNTGAGIPNGTYQLRFVSNGTGAVSNEVTFTIACPFERSINISNIGYNCDGTLNVSYEAVSGYDGEAPVGFSNGNFFELQKFNGLSWVIIDMIATSGSNYEVELPYGGFPKLENGANLFRLAYNVEGTPCYSNQFELEVSCIESHAPATLSFSLNVPSSPDVSPNGMTFKVTVDGTEYSTTADTVTSYPAIALHETMRDILQGNSLLDSWVVNGSETNYSYTLKAPAGSNGTWNGKVVRVEVLDPLEIGYGNITVAGEFFGTDAGEGVFLGGY